MPNLEKLLSEKNIFHIEGIDFLIANSHVIAFIEDLKIFPLKQSHIEFLKKNRIPIDPNIKNAYS